MHLVFACPKPCERLHNPCNHSCQKATCGEDCGVCMVALDNIELPCGHSKDSVPCYMTQNLGKIKCTVLVQKEVPGCGHLVNVSCIKDVAAATFKCPTPCDTMLACGHPCPGSCAQCHAKQSPNGAIVKQHQECSKVCGRPLSTCNHRCRMSCHKDRECGPCMSDCEVSRHFHQLQGILHHIRYCTMATAGAVDHWAN